MRPLQEFIDIDIAQNKTEILSCNSFLLFKLKEKRKNIEIYFPVGFCFCFSNFHVVSAVTVFVLSIMNKI